MSYQDVYIGELEDPRFSWDEGHWTHNIPRPISPFFPPLKGQEDIPYRLVINRIKNGELKGKQTDFAGWVAKVSKTDIESLMEELYGASSSNPPKYRSKEIRNLYSAISNLNPDKIYALVACSDWDGLFSI